MNLRFREQSTETVRVFLLVENRLVREALARLFRKRPDLSVVGENYSTEPSDWLDVPSDVIILDDFSKAIQLGVHFCQNPSTVGTAAVVAIGMDDDIEKFFNAVRSGVSGYLLSDASAEDVVAAVRAAAHGGALCSPQLCLALFRSMARSARPELMRVNHETHPRLTIRQQQLVALVAKGLTNKEIASQLCVSEYTVKNHLRRIMKQMKAANRSMVAEVARNSGYVLAAAA